MARSAEDYFREESRMEVAARMVRKGMVSANIVEVADLSKKQVETQHRKMNGAASS